MRPVVAVALTKLISGPLSLNQCMEETHHFTMAWKRNKLCVSVTSWPISDPLNKGSLCAETAVVHRNGCTSLNNVSPL